MQQLGAELDADEHIDTDIKTYELCHLDQDFELSSSSSSEYSSDEDSDSEDEDSGAEAEDRGSEEPADGIRYSADGVPLNY